MKLNTSRQAAGKSRTWNAPPSGSRPGLKALAPVGACARATQAMTLAELIVAVGVGSLLLMVMAVVFMTGTRAFATMSNYVSMDVDSRNALDHLTQEVRRAGDLVEFSPTHLKFGWQGQTNAFLVYDWDAASGQLTQWNTADGTTNVLLTGCDQLAFSLYNSSFAPTTIPSQGKGISVSWTCSRTILGVKSTTEDMQQALIVIRNKAL